MQLADDCETIHTVSLEQTLTLLLVVATFALVLSTLYVAVATVRSLTRQMQLTAFAEYTRRYNELIEVLPFDAARPSGSVRLQTLQAEEKERLMKCMRQYFNLCWEEMHLVKGGQIDQKTWDIWAAGIRDTLRAPFFKEAWIALRPEYTYGEYARAFIAMIDGATALRAEGSSDATTGIDPTSSAESGPQVHSQGTTTTKR